MGEDGSVQFFFQELDAGTVGFNDARRCGGEAGPADLLATASFIMLTSSLARATACELLKPCGSGPLNLNGQS